MTRITVLLAAIAAALAVVFAAPAAVTATKLVGTDGPGFTITLKKGTTKVKTLKAGTYKIVVRDKSKIHNFHLSGPGVNKKTSVTFSGTKTWTLKLKKGTYKYVCDPHKATMHGTFRVK